MASSKSSPRPVWSAFLGGRCPRRSTRYRPWTAIWSKEYQAKQAELVAKHIKSQDIVITTALIPGRPAPKLISTAMVASMKPGSVIVDLAAERGGNAELTKPDEVVEHKACRSSAAQPAGPGAVNASSLYAKNLLAFLETMIDKKDKMLGVNWDDEIVKGTLVAGRRDRAPEPAAEERGVNDDTHRNRASSHCQV